MATNKPDLTRVWANGAPQANVVDPDTTTPGKFNAGWQAEVPPFEHFNFLQKMFTQGLAHFNEQGIGVWDANTVYPLNGLTKGSDGRVYSALLEQSSNDPVSDSGNNWTLFLNDHYTDLVFASVSEMQTGKVNVNYSVGMQLRAKTGKVVTDYAVGASGDIPLTGGLFATANIDSFTVISDSMSKLIDLSNGFLGKQVLITGDSLSFNGFGYPGSWVVNGGGYATDQPVGLGSWSNLFRDSVICSNVFQPIYDTDWATNTTAATISTEIDLQFVGLNSNIVYFDPLGGLDETTIVSDFDKDVQLLIATRPAGTGITFKINGVSHDSDSLDGHHSGYGYKLIPFTPVSGKYCNITEITGGAVGVYGIAGSTLKIPVVTGKGGYNSTQILAEYNTLVAAYNPDIIFYIIGANDVTTGNPVESGYNTSVQAFIDNAKTQNPNVEIILISSSVDGNVTAQQTRDYVNAGYEMALKNDISFIDLYHELLGYDAGDWRFDNIHANVYGDTVWFNIFKNLLFPSLKTVGDYKPVRQLFTKNDISQYYSASSFGFTVQCVAGAPVITSYTNDLFTGKPTVEYSNDAGAAKIIEVKLPFGFELQSITPMITSSAQPSVAAYKERVDSRNHLVSTLQQGTFTQLNPEASGVYFVVSAVRI